MAIGLTGLGIWEYRISDQRVTISPEVRTIYHIPPEVNVTYEFFLSRIIDQDREQIILLMEGAGVLREKESFLRDIRILCDGDKSIRWVRIKGKYMEASSDSDECIRGTIIDVTAEKTENDRLERFVTERTYLLEETNRKLADSNAELAMFAFTAIHDLREPLRKLVSYATLIERSAY